MRIFWRKAVVLLLVRVRAGVRTPEIWHRSGAFTLDKRNQKEGCAGHRLRHLLDEEEHSAVCLLQLASANGARLLVKSNTSGSTKTAEEIAETAAAGLSAEQRALELTSNSQELAKAPLLLPRSQELKTRETQTTPLAVGALVLAALVAYSHSRPAESVRDGASAKAEPDCKSARSWGGDTAATTAAGDSDVSSSDEAVVKKEVLKENGLTAFYGALVITFSIALIHVNKWIMKEEHFPFAEALVFMHMIFCSSVGSLLLVVTPSLFPALTDPTQKVDLTFSYFLKSCLPIAMCFAASLVLSNVAYTYLSVAFIQMIKESNIVWVYVFSLFVGREVIGWGQVQIVVLAICGMCMTIHGEMNFSAFGFFAQASAILFESTRVMLQAAILSGGGRKLDPLSYVMIVSPISAVIIGATMGITCHFPADAVNGSFALPMFAKTLEFAPYLLASACLAFALNVSIALLIKRTSPMSYIMCQLVKDVGAVAIGVTFMKEEVSHMQAVGFAVQLMAVMAWSGLKNYPERVEGGLVNFLVSSMRSLWSRPSGTQDPSLHKAAA
eukprot:TRINITY_DN15975_c0_g2_i5.p1 TRINITY_DN15975_c0_g2~~TRINITY_DN15975_c0_g2_i5.p1  ORF type:complete len:555 (+),score=131.93 TRINITY_DN15975_c0_g2_i5:254-1918(+)